MITQSAITEQATISRVTISAACVTAPPVPGLPGWRERPEVLAFEGIPRSFCPAAGTRSRREPSVHPESHPDSGGAVEATKCVDSALRRRGFRRNRGAAAQAHLPCGASTRRESTTGARTTLI